LPDGNAVDFIKEIKAKYSIAEIILLMAIYQTNIARLYGLF